MGAALKCPAQSTDACLWRAEWLWIGAGEPWGVAGGAAVPADAAGADGQRRGGQRGQRGQPHSCPGIQPLFSLCLKSLSQPMSCHLVHLWLTGPFHTELNAFALSISTAIVRARRVGARTVLQLVACDLSQAMQCRSPSTTHQQT